jgi:hypothetical protein
MNSMLGTFLMSCCLLYSSAHAAALTVHECRGQHGERIFTDRAVCAHSAVRTLVLSVAPAPPASATVTPPRGERMTSTSQRRRAPATSPARPDSYRCDSGGRSWYQHSPCSAGADRTGKAGKSSRKGTEKVRQTRVSRAQACREIDRPAALLRAGSERDERAGPYAKATGRNPCR